MRSFLLYVAAGAVALALAVGACSDDDPAQDAGADGAPPADAAPDATAKPDGPGLLAIGAFKDFPADKSGKIDVTIPTRLNDKFMLLLLSLDFTPLKVYSYVAAEASAGASKGYGMAPPPAPPRQELAPAPEQQASRPDLFQRELARILASRPKQLFEPRYHPFAATPPKLGDTHTFAVQGKTITAKVIYVDSVGAFWMDQTTQPVGTVDPQTLKEIADGFAKVVVPRERTLIGQESDIDNDGRISVLLSPLVTTSGAIAYVSPCDLLDPKLVPVCAGSHQMELIYSRPPKDLPSMWQSNLVGSLLELFAHEFQHAIYFYRKYMLNNLTIQSENPYITEGTSDLAADRVGYNGGLIHRWKAGLDGVNDLSVPNMTSSAIKSYVPQYDGTMRGGIDLLVHYMYDLAGGDSLDSSGKLVDKGGIKWLRAFVDSKDLGEDNFIKTANLTKEELVKQFFTALALSNRGTDGGPINKDPKYNFLPTDKDATTGYARGLNLYASYKSFKMMGPRVQSIASPDGQLRAGGAEFLQTLAKGSKLRFVIKTEAAAKAMVRLIRIN